MRRTLALAGLALLLGSLTACGAPVEGTVVSKRVIEKHKESDTQCNGDPVLLICQDTEVEVPAAYLIKVAYPKLESLRDYSGEKCELEVTEELYQKLEAKMPVLLKDPTWAGCGVSDWTVTR